MTTDTIPQWTFGDRLAKAREHAGISVEQMADELGVSRNTIGNYEAERTTPKAGVVKAWALITGVSFEWIVEGRPSSEWSTAGDLCPGQMSLLAHHGLAA